MSHSGEISSSDGATIVGGFEGPDGWQGFSSAVADREPVPHFRVLRATYTYNNDILNLKGGFTGSVGPEDFNIRFIYSGATVVGKLDSPISGTYQLYGESF